MRAILKFAVSLVLPRNDVDLRVRCVSAFFFMFISAFVGHWVCSDQWLRTWWVCGILGITSAAPIAGWIGGRVPILIPLIMFFLTPVFTLSYMDLARTMGHPLDAKYGIDVIGLSLFAGIAGVLIMLHIPLYRYLVLAMRRPTCEEKSSYAELERKASH